MKYNLTLVVIAFMVISLAVGILPPWEQGSRPAFITEFLEDDEEDNDVITEPLEFDLWVTNGDCCNLAAGILPPWEQGSRPAFITEFL